MNTVVRVADNRAQDVRAGGGDVHRAPSVAGGDVEVARGVRVRHGDDVGQVEVGGPRRFPVVVGVHPAGRAVRVIARGRDEQDAALAVGVNRVQEALRELLEGPAVVGRHDVHAAVLHPSHVVQAGDPGGDGPDAVGVEHLARHEPDIPAHPGDPDAVVADRPDDPRHVRAVVVVVDRVRVAVDRSNPEAIVDEPVAVVVEAVGVAVGLVAEHVRRQVLVRVVDAGVDDRHHHGRAARREIPGLRGIDVDVLREDRRVQPPLVAGEEMRIVRHGLQRHDVIRLGVEHFREPPIPGNRLRRRQSAR